MVDGGMMNIEQHQKEILQNNMPLLGIKKGLPCVPIYRVILQSDRHADRSFTSGRLLNLVSGAGNLKIRSPHAICTDLFQIHWLDAVWQCLCDAF